MTASTSSSWSSPTLTTASTGRLVSRKYGRSSARALGVEVAAVERGALGQRRPRPRRAPPPRRPGDLSALAALRRLVTWFSTVSRSARVSSSSTTRRCSSGSVGPGHVGVGERPQHVDDGVDLADVGQEAVAQALALAGPLDQPADVDELHAGGHHVAAGGHRGQRVEPVVGHLGHAHVGVAGGEGVGRGERAAAGEGVVQRRLAGVGEADEPEPFHRRQATTPAATLCRQ